MESQFHMYNCWIKIVKIVFFFSEDTKTQWISRDIYGSGSGCSMNIMMSAYYTAYVTVSMISSNGETPMLRRMFSFKDM